MNPPKQWDGLQYLLISVQICHSIELEKIIEETMWISRPEKTAAAHMAEFWGELSCGGWALCKLLHKQECQNIIFLSFSESLEFLNTHPPLVTPVHAAPWISGWHRMTRHSQTH